MAVVHVSIANAQFTGATSAIINKPASVAVGDLLLACVGISTNNNITSTGWTSVIQQAPAAGTGRLGILYRVVDGTEGASFTFSFTTASNGIGVISRYTGVYAVTPIEAQSSGNGASSTTHTAPTATSVSANAFIARVYFGIPSNFTSARSYTITGPPELYDASHTAGYTVMSAGDVQAVAGATGTQAATFSIAGNWGAATLALTDTSVVAPTAVPRIGMVGV